MIGWWSGKVRRFARYFTGRVRRSERSELARWLTQRQVDLFEQMHPADQRHGLDVIESLRRAGHDDLDLLLAGLLHDCAKGRRLRVWHRVGWSLAEHYGPRVKAILGRLPGFRTAFGTLEQHAERSALLANGAGCSARTVDLIRHQADPIDQELGVALRLADEAS